MSGTGRPVPPADVVLACPLTFNSVNKFAHGHADNFALGLLCEMAGYGVPVVVVPHCKPQLATHPAFSASLQTLRGMGVRVLFDPDAPYERRLPPWREVVDALPVRPRHRTRGCRLTNPPNASMSEMVSLTSWSQETIAFLLGSCDAVQHAFKVQSYSIAEIDSNRLQGLCDQGQRKVAWRRTC
jgi:hypothetical protein